MVAKLTNEEFKDLFTDNFTLANYAIAIAQRQIEGGNEDLNLTELLEAIKTNSPLLTEEEVNE